ncbi:LLM class flavin-dependent oxidoreductase [Actinomycetaceae bacterium WB03_NA08]|uniref:LLM class flavin-dependent oxidoreductase n=1 Tax=Scrofimicrobium canadense TaxID=2652290 RepID=A0A6N7VU96_9ACTO|nr:LLM class flavin-dependent oxidoreductase [Scrofimicrobium canadense]MSS85344.1 LLM class flavin-dependent oxidoreductase [Scrofimicrobium canadense]
MTGLTIGLSLSPTWLRGGAWRDPSSGIEDLLSGELFIRAAQLAEQAHMDFVFKPDALLLKKEPLVTWPGFTGLDPVVMMSVIARETHSIGLVPTFSSSFTQPYFVARETQSLNHISRGRAGWNVVTSLGGKDNFVGVEQRTSVELYQDAQDYVETVRRLWGSYPASAIVLDRHQGIFAKPELVRPISSPGVFDVAGPLTVPAYDDHPLPLLHAGGSAQSKHCAARYADAVFAMNATTESGVALKEELAELAEREGREPTAVRVLPGLSLCLASNREKAEDLAAQSFDSYAPGHVKHWSVVGTPSDAVEAIVRRYEAGGADGFIALPAGSWNSLQLLVDEVIPRLAELGLFRSEYHSHTLRGHLGMGE